MNFSARDLHCFLNTDRIVDDDKKLKKKKQEMETK